LARVQHLIVLRDKHVRLSNSHIVQLVLVVSATFFKGLARVFFLSLNTLELGKILPIWKETLEFVLLAFIAGEVFGDIVNDIFPLFLKHVAFFKAGTDTSFVLFIVCSYLSLTFLINFDFKTAFSRPLFPKVFI
jgi:hypothetical protein